jgi:hypothetical protein
MMKISKRKAMVSAAVCLGALGWTAPAMAQATRTWVSGVGDDVNPCSRTAPCKTFAGAISKTAAGGEINCLDPGGFGALSINKSLTINCIYTEGGMLAAGNGIVINDSTGPTPGASVIFLRGLDIFGVSPPSNGVRITLAGEVHIEDSTIRRFNAAGSFGISFQPSGTTTLYVSRTTIANNGSGVTGGGILVQPTGAGNARVVLQDVMLHGNANNALRVDTTGNSGAGSGINVIADESHFIGSANGISVNVPAGTSNANVMVTDSIVALNTTAGIAAGGSANARVRVGNTTITANLVGVSPTGGAIINTYGNNRLEANGPGGGFTLPAIPEN